MTTARFTATAVLLSAHAALAPAPASAAVYRCASSDCSIATQARPLAFRERSWTLIIAAHPATAALNSANAAGLFTLPGVVQVGASSSAAQITLFQERSSLTLSAPYLADAGERLTIGLSWERNAGRATLFVRAGDRALETRTIVNPSWAGRNLGADTCDADIDGDGKVGPSDQLALLASWGPCPQESACDADIDGDGSVGPTDQLALLASLGPCPGGSGGGFGATLGASEGIFDTGFMGDIGPVILRAGAITPSDFDAITTSDELLASVFFNTTTTGGALTGVGSVEFAMAHGGPANVGEAVAADAIFLFNRSVGGRFMDRAPNTQVLGEWIRISPYDEHGYTRSPLPVALAEPPFIAKPAPMLRQIATGAFTQQIRALVHGNSRAARITSEHGVSQSYSHGWVSNRPHDVVGWLLRPPLAPQGRGDWWGFDHEPTPPRQVGTINLSTTDFSRFGQTSVTTRDRGPGTVAGVALGGFYRALAHPELGMRASEPVRAGAILLQYPGSANTVVHAVRTSAGDATTGALGATTPVWLDTTRFSYSFSNDDAAQTVQSQHFLVGATIPKTLLTVDADAAADARVGDAVYGVFEGAHSASVIESIATLGNGRVELLLATELAGSPAPGDTLFFGPWAYTWIELDHPPDAVNPWRGVQVVNAGGGGPGPVVIIGLSAYVPDKPGMALCTFGAGGDGYRDHLEDEIPGAARRLAQTLGIDAALMTPAQQNSIVSDMELYVQQLRLGRPNIELALLGDGAFNPSLTPGIEATGFFTFWNGGFLERAAALDAVAVDGARGARLGRFLDRVADGQMNDPAHQSSRGAARQAEEWDRLLAIAALPRAGDVDGDDVINSNDLLALLSSWGACAPTATSVCPADFDRDGAIGPSDLLTLLTAFGK